MINGVPFIYSKDLPNSTQLVHLNRITHPRVYPYGTEYIDIPKRYQDVASAAYTQAQQNFIRIFNTNKIIYNKSLISLSDQALPDHDLLLHSIKHKFYVNEYNHVVYFPETEQIMKNILSALRNQEHDGPNDVNLYLWVLINHSVGLKNSINYVPVFSHIQNVSEIHY